MRVLGRILINALAMALEIASAVGIAMLAFRLPLMFAALTGIVALVMGTRLERARLVNEIPFYFGIGARRSSVMVTTVAAAEAAVKAVIAAAVALITVSGTDQTRLYWVAILFGVSVYIASTVLRWIAIRLGAMPSRWGYFRMAAPFGLLFSVAMGLLTEAKILSPPTYTDLARRLVFDLPKKPNLAEASEMLFLLKQKVDELVLSFLNVFLGPQAGQAVGMLLSVNALAGFLIAIYAAMIAELVLKLEDLGE
jgi:hypothetical protein